MTLFAVTLTYGLNFLPQTVTLTRPQATPNSGTLTPVDVPLMVKSIGKTFLAHRASKTDRFHRHGLAIFTIVMAFPKKHVGRNTYATRVIPPIAH